MGIDLRYWLYSTSTLFWEVRGRRDKLSFLGLVGARIGAKVLPRYRPLATLVQSVQVLRFKEATLCFQVVGGELTSYVQVFVEKTYELDPTFVASRNDTVLDLGANIGVYTISQARRAREGRVFSCEPDPSAYQRLCKNVALNGLTNVTCVNEAMGARDGAQSFWVHPRMTGVGSLVRGSHHASQIQVKVSRIDSMLQRYGVDRVDLIKVNVEGAEGEVLRGAERALGRATRVVVQCHSDALANGTRACLEPYGFRLVLQRPLGTWEGGQLSIGYYAKAH